MFAGHKDFKEGREGATSNKNENQQDASWAQISKSDKKILAVPAILEEN